MTELDAYLSGPSYSRLGTSANTFYEPVVTMLFVDLFPS